MDCGNYTLLDRVGVGSTCTVYRAQFKQTQHKCAVKRICKAGVSPKTLRKVRSEIELMQTLDHPFVVSFYDSFEDDKAIYIVMEYCGGGTLGDLIHRMGKLDEHQASVIATEVALALDYLQREAHVIHRDVKPENILLDSNGHARLSDLGFGTHGDADSACRRTACGSPSYIAPEIIKGEEYTGKVDVWSFGVVLFTILTGQQLFGSTPDNIAECLRDICEKKIEIPGTLSEQVRDLLARTIERKWRERLSVDAVLRHPWITEQESYHKIADACGLVRSFSSDVQLSKDTIEGKMGRDSCLHKMLAARVGGIASGFRPRQVKTFAMYPTKSLGHMKLTLNARQGTAQPVSKAVTGLRDSSPLGVKRTQIKRLAGGVVPRKLVGHQLRLSSHNLPVGERP